VTIAKFIFGVMLTLSPLASWASDDSADDLKVKVAKDLYAAFSRNDMPAVLSLFSADVVFKFHGPEELVPQAGTYKGHHGVAQFFARIGENFHISEIGQRLFSVEGNVVAVVGWENGVSKTTGGQYTANWVHLLTIEDDSIIHFEEITDSGAIIEALAPANVARGEAFYATCLACHGVEGQGQQGMHAPRLTLQDSDYLLQQLRNFRQMVRGGVQDFYGWQMNGRANALPGDRALRDVVAYIETLPDTYATDDVIGDLKRGQSIYESSCASCHGQAAEGNPALSSPALGGLDGWYQLEQLKKFKTGVRGEHQEDLFGAQMRAAVNVLQTEQDMNNVVSYIMTLTPRK
jgi:cytochrome c553